MAKRRALGAWLLFAAAVSVTACERAPNDHVATNAHPCVSCHFAEYRDAPHHEHERPMRCEVCHTSEAWSPSVLRHRWPLTGAHARTNCLQCHTGSPPSFEGTGTACVDCHRDDYDLRTFPENATFPTTCERCHTTAAWTPATFDPRAEAVPTASPTTPTPRPSPRPRHEPHGAEPAPSIPPAPPATPPTPTHPESRFPIATGHHAGIACLTCHDQGGTMGRGNTDCVQCHPRGRYDGIHISVDGYPRGSAPSNFCVDCHHRGTRSRSW